MAIEEKDGAESLVLGRGSHFSFECEVGDKGIDLFGPQFTGMALAVEENELPDPGNIGAFSAPGIVLGSQLVTELFEKFTGGSARIGHKVAFLSGYAYNIL